MALLPPPPQRGQRLSFLGTSLWTLDSVDSLILPNERRKYEQHFHQLDADRDGFVQAPEGKHLLARSKIPARIIDEIWAFCNTPRSSGLSCREFTCAMHLTFQAMHVTSSALGGQPQQANATPQSGETKTPVVPPPWLLAAQQEYKSSQMVSPVTTPPPRKPSVNTAPGVIQPASDKPENWERFSPTGPGSGFSNVGQGFVPANQGVSFVGSGLISPEVLPTPWVTFDSGDNHRRLNRHTSMPESQLNPVWSTMTQNRGFRERQPSGPFAPQPAIFQGGQEQAFERTLSPEPKDPLIGTQPDMISQRSARLRRRPMTYEIGKRQQKRRTRSLYGTLSEDLTLYSVENSDSVQIKGGALSPVPEMVDSLPPVAVEDTSSENVTEFQSLQAQTSAEAEINNQTPRARTSSLTEAKPSGQSLESQEHLKQSTEILEVVGLTNKLREEEEVLQKEIVEARGEESGLQKRLEEVTAEKKEVEETIGRGKNELQQLRSNVDDRRAELTRLEDEMHDLKRKRSQLDSEKDSLQLELVNAETLLREKRERLEAERARTTQAEETVAALKTKMQASTSALNEVKPTVYPRPLSKPESKTEPQPAPVPWAPLAVQVPTLSPTSPSPADASTNQAAPRGPMSGTPFSAFDGEDLFKLEAELGEGSCRQMLAEDQSPGSMGFVWPAISPPVTRLPTLAVKKGAQPDGGHVAPIPAQAPNEGEENEREVIVEVKAPANSTPKQTGTPKGGILSPKRPPPPPPTKVPTAAPADAVPAAAAAAPALQNPQTSPSKMRNKAESVTLDWANGEDSWLHFDDSPPLAGLPGGSPLLPDVVVAEVSIPSADVNPVPLSAAYLSAKVHPEPEGGPLSPDSLAAPSPSVRSFLGELASSERGLVTGQSFSATEGPQKPAFASLATSLSPSVQSFLNVSTFPAGPPTSLPSAIPAALGGQNFPVVGGQNSPSAPGSPAQFKTPLRKPPPPPSGLKKTGGAETPNPATPNPATPNTAVQDAPPGQLVWAEFGDAEQQKAPASAAPTAISSDGTPSTGFAKLGEPLSPSSDLFMKVGGLGAPAKLPSEWTALRPNPVYEPNGGVRRRRSSDGDLVQEKKPPLVAEPEPKLPASEPTAAPALAHAPAAASQTVTSQSVTSPGVTSQPTSPDSSRMNLLEDDWFLASGQTPTSPSAVAQNAVGDANRGSASAGLRPLTEADRKKCTAAFEKIARPGREFVSRTEAEGICSRANIPGQPFERLWALSDRAEDGVLGKDEFCIFLLLMKAAAAREQLPGGLSTGDVSRLLGHEFVAEKITRSFIPTPAKSSHGRTPTAERGGSPGTDSGPRNVVLGADLEVPPALYSSPPQLDSPTARGDLSPGKTPGPGGEAWEDYLAKRVGSAEDKPSLANANPTEGSFGDQSPSVSRIPSPSKRSSLPETGGITPVQGGSPLVQTVRPPSVVARPLSSQSFRSASLRIRVGPEDEDRESGRFVGERVRRFSSQEGGIAYLVGMGFGPKAAAAATARFGSDLQAAVAWLLEQPGRGVDPADVLASADRDLFPLTPPPAEKTTARNLLNTEPIASDSPPAGRGLDSARARRHVAGGESKIPSPPRRDGNSPNGSPVKKPTVVSPSMLKPPVESMTPPSESSLRTPESPEKKFERNPSILDRIGAAESDGSDEEEEVVVGTEVERPQSARPPGSPLSQMIGSLWGAGKTAPGTPTGQTKIEKGLVAHNVEKFEKGAAANCGPRFVTQLPVQLLIEEVALEDADDLRDPFITVAVYDESGALIEPAQNTSIVSNADERGIVFGTRVDILGKIPAVPPSGTKVCFEVRHFKRGETSKASTKCWTAINLEEMATGPHTLVLFKKPVDLKAKRAKLLNGKRDVLKINVDFQE
ncbi:hypothetical protein KFL_007700050 [Klebsormidium nitens]|uniref:Uncharacterized protein n=1 Tax=Klebsormidium nitens TaxID=105231 RepID=A0A1Y1IT41_KLENI|nr:hypothetical protein KFL_007700050 [Klebsormidium nitens]|eukprot:GAQ91348.1 hypothetical protein KFL_007700050 [Klebsormidium nitens]